MANTKENLQNTFKALLPKFIYVWFKKIRLAYKLVFLENSYLVESGFVHSMVSESLQNKDKEYIPWMNYPTVDFLKERLTNDMNVFEYGSGASTFFLAKRTKEVVSIEYDRKWYDTISKNLVSKAENVQLHYTKLDEEYPNAIKKYSQNKKYDVIIIDGRERVKCAIASIDYLSEKGILIFDDSSRTYYKEGIEFYLEKGFKALTFSGIKPTDYRENQTKILYRKENCFGI